MSGKLDDYLAIGRIVGPHGIRGEVKVSLLTDFPERFTEGKRVFTSDQTSGVVERGILAARPHKGMMLVQLEGVKDRNAAESLRDALLLIPANEAMPLGEHENYVHDLIGLKVLTTDGTALGELTEVMFTRANDVYVVERDGEELLIPAVREVVLKVDLETGTMIVQLPDGLLS